MVNFFVFSELVNFLGYSSQRCVGVHSCGGSFNRFVMLESTEVHVVCQDTESRG